jgi:hypothetical protein|tara:strand:+ start:419 stop:616 length:198 start_codon:yes stop_codon:yes gene_type:complete
MGIERVGASGVFGSAALLSEDARLSALKLCPEGITSPCASAADCACRRDEPGTLIAKKYLERKLS